MNQEEKANVDRIVKIIDPDNSFLGECEDAVKWRKECASKNEEKKQ